MDWFFILVSILYTIILYGVGPLLFALLRKKPVTKGQVKGFSILYSFSAWFCSNLFWALYAGDPVSSGGAALLWGWIFYKLLKNHLDKTSRLTGSMSAIPASRYQAQEKKMGKFVVDTETGEVIKEDRPRPEEMPSTTNSNREPADDTESVLQEEPPVVQFPQPAESVIPNAPENRWYKIAIAALSAACVILAIFAFLLGYSANSMKADYQQLSENVEALTAENAALQETVSKLESKNERAQKKISNLMEERNTLSERLSSANARIDEMREPFFFLLNRIGFIVDGSRYYHNYDCSVFQAADTYWAHNVEYCEYLGYSKCPNCW